MKDKIKAKERRSRRRSVEWRKKEEEVWGEVE